MTDQTTPPITGQSPLPPTEPIKNTFFGGEVPFDDTTTFEAMHAPQTEDADTEQKVDIEQKAEPDFSNFDPFEEENTQNDQQEKQEAETPGTSMDEEISPEEQTPSTSEQYAPSLDSINEPSTSPLETVENTTSALPIIENFLNLIKTTKMIFSLQEDQQSFSILGNKTIKSTLEYHVYLVEDEENHIDLFIKKVDTDNETQEEDEHLLQCSYHTQLQTLDIFVDEVLLYQLEKNANERIILDKLEKFGFLFDTFYADMNKAYSEKQEMENKKKQLHEIFRNF